VFLQREAELRPSVEVERDVGQGGETRRDTAAADEDQVDVAGASGAAADGQRVLDGG
jgi:hypothetical protein